MGKTRVINIVRYETVYTMFEGSSQYYCNQQKAQKHLQNTIRPLTNIFHTLRMFCNGQSCGNDFG